MTNDYDLPMEEYRRAGLEITKGNPDVYKSLWSRRDDVTLANPFGPPVRGWEEVSARLDLAASNYCDGQDYEFENISTVVTRELAYTSRSNAFGRAWAARMNSLRSPSGRRPSFAVRTAPGR
jgi:hypothetical protein